MCGAMIVQPANHMYDHSYVTSVLTAHPDKFVGCLLADPTPGELQVRDSPCYPAPASCDGLCLSFSNPGYLVQLQPCREREVAHVGMFASKGSDT